MRRWQHVVGLALAIWLPVLIANIWLLPLLPPAIQARISIAFTSLIIIIACLSNVAVVHEYMQRYLPASRPTRRDMEKARERYCRHISERYLPYKLTGLPALRWEPRAHSFQRLYVQPRLRPWMFEHKSPSSQGIESPDSIANILSHRRRIVILGESGAGKTSLMQYLNLTLTEDHGVGTGLGFDMNISPRLLPVYIDLDDFVAWLGAERRSRHMERPIHSESPNIVGVPLFDFVSDQLEAEGLRLPAGMFEHFLGRGECLVMLDGLDRVISPIDRAQVRRVVETIVRFTQSQRLNNRVMVTSRIADYKLEPFEGFDHYEITLFGSTEVDEFVSKWRDAYRRARTESGALLPHRTTWSPRVSRLAANPMYLAILALVYQRTGKLPNQKAALYKEIISSAFVRNTPGAAVKTLHLEQLGFWMQTRGEGVTHDDVAKKLARLLRDQDNLGLTESTARASEFMTWATERSGILLVSQGGACQFAHPSFQQYFAAADILRRFRENPSDLTVLRETVLERLHEPTWLDVHLFLVSQLDTEAATRIAREVLDKRTPYSEIYPRDLLMALRFLAEDAPISDEVKDGILDDIWGRIFTQTADVSWRSGLWNRYYHEALAVLPDVHGSKIETALLDRLLNTLHEIGNRGGIRARAAEWLGQMNSANQAVVESLIGCLCDGDPTVQDMSRRALVHLAEQHEPVILRLEGMVAAEDQPEVSRVHIARALIHLDRAHELSLAVALRLPLGTRESQNAQARARRHMLKEWVNQVTRADGAQGRLEEVRLSAEPLLARSLRSDVAETRSMVAWVLGKLRCESDSTVSDLLVAARDTDPRVREQARWALGEIGRDEVRIIGELTNGLSDEAERPRHAASVALSKITGVVGGQG